MTHQIFVLDPDNLTLTLDYPALTTPIDRLESLLTVFKLPPIPTLTAWPAPKFHLDCLASPVMGGSTVAYVVSLPCHTLFPMILCLIFRRIAAVHDQFEKELEDFTQYLDIAANKHTDL